MLKEFLPETEAPIGSLITFNVESPNWATREAQCVSRTPQLFLASLRSSLWSNGWFKPLSLALDRLVRGTSLKSGTCSGKSAWWLLQNRAKGTEPLKYQTRLFPGASETDLTTICNGKTLATTKEQWNKP